ncbi:MAG: cell wall-binding repeat-containing protein [Coriobacteriia bacterium]|nr:cell wall-binding repeat-containing protein [Coriobacteriia bacterium]
MSANWAYSPALRKFVDGLPGLGPDNANDRGQFLAVGHPDTTTYPGSDYYEIELREYDEKLHSDLPPTRLRGYVQVNNGTDAEGNNTIAPDPIHYLGPTIFASKNRPVRVKFTNMLPTGEGGDLFIPVDTSVMGAGMGPLGEAGGMYTQNRATMHLHGGKTPWISDGTPHQWITPAGEDTPYPKGVSVRNVPDMPDPGDGSMTFFYTNQQSARMLWYHDHAYGITRLNVYAGEAAAYMLTDEMDQQLIADGIIPEDQIPLVVQDKTFVDAETIGDWDPTWNWGTTPGTPSTGDLWMPHVYVPAQNPYDVEGVNPFGRWHYGPWFWPPTNDIEVGPVPNPYYDPINAPWQPPEIPGTPHPSMGMESFFDTALVNGTAFPTLEVDPKAYRFRVLNAANDRFWNLQMYEAVSAQYVTRTAGPTRYETAVESAVLAHPDWTGVEHVIIASGEEVSQPDALAAAGLVGLYDAPLLLTQQGSLTAVTRAALLAMPDGVQVHIVGGPVAVSSTVMAAIATLDGIGGVDRISGADRYETAVAVGVRMKSVLGAEFPTSAFVVNGQTPGNFFDSLIASPASVSTHYPILFVRPDSVPAVTSAAIASLGITRPYIVGGPAAVAPQVATALGIPAGDRIWGANRFATAVAFAERAQIEAWLDLTYVGVAQTIVDALSGGASAGGLNGPMLLTNRDSLPAETRDALVAHTWDIEQAYVFGGTSVVTPATFNAIQAALAKMTEVKMVPASPTQTNFPADWPTDGRAGGVPDPDTAGPAFVQIGTEGGFLPAPAVLEQQPITWYLDPTVFNVGNVDLHTLLLGPAERADVVVDFSEYAGKTLIVYNDAPAAFPALDPRYDYYTGNPDLTDSGGHWGTKPAHGPNIRTVMQIKVKDAAPAPAFDLASLEDAFASNDERPGVFEASQDPIIVTQDAYDSAYNKDFAATWPDWGLVRIQDNRIVFKTLASTTATVPLEPKAIQDEMGEAFDPVYGRMSGMLGLELAFTQAGRQNFTLQGFVDPPTEILFSAVETTTNPQYGDGVQIWKITHNGVDTHPLHFHMFDVQLINRVGWDGIIRLPDSNELGWKDTVRISPLEDTIVAMRPVAPKQPFGVPESIRPFNPAMPLGTMEGFIQIDPLTGQPKDPPTVNEWHNFGWEYVLHCHILSHEEMDMMRPMSVWVDKFLATAPVLDAAGVPGSDITLTWIDATPWDGLGPTSTVGDLSNEIGFRVERSVSGADDWSVVGAAIANQTTFVDSTTEAGTAYDYRVVAWNVAGDSASDPVTVNVP